MVRMMIYGGSEGANAILQISPGLTPNNRCICKKTALQHHSQEKPLRPFDPNRLVPVKKNNMTYGVVKEHHIIYRYENGTIAKEEWLQTGDPLSPPAHQNKEGYNPNGWTPDLPSTASGDGDYTMKYSIKQYTITFLDKDGNILQQGLWNHGTTPTAPSNTNTPSGWAFDGWDPAIVPATSDKTYRGQYHQLGPDPQGDIPVDPDDPSKKGRDAFAYTMDNMYQTVDANRIATGNLKPKPQTSIKDGVDPDGISWVPYVNGVATWWSGPMDGKEEDSKYGADNGICARRIAGRDQANGSRFFDYDTDGCVYEYAKPSGHNWPNNNNTFSGSTVNYSDLVSHWECDCYDGNEYIGKYIIHSNVDWVKFVVSSETWTINDIRIPFSVTYYVDENRNNGPARKGTVSVTTPGRVSHYDANYHQKGLPYITNGTTYFYQQSAAEAYDV